MIDPLALANMADAVQLSALLGEGDDLPAARRLAELLRRPGAGRDAASRAAICEQAQLAWEQILAAQAELGQ